MVVVISRRYAERLLVNRFRRSSSVTVLNNPLCRTLLVATLACLTTRSPAADPPNFSTKARVAWTTSRVKGSPDPPSPYVTRVAFPDLTFDEPLDMNYAPGINRLLVVERFGRIFSVPLDRKTAKPDLILDANQVLGRTKPKTLSAYGFALHPQYPKVRYAYATIVTSNTEELPRGSRLSRFRVLPGEPPRCDPKSEQILFEWPSGGHNGGCLQFGPDGYLYIATGDSSGIADLYLTGQDLTNLSGAILRIDVDHPGEKLPYTVPRDNPFLSTKGARPEIWAYGLRQPWKMSFDTATGDLWTGNIGQDLWEMVFRIERGGNYGWSITEGTHPFEPERPRGPTAIIPPIIEHDHANFRSITGGFVYHGKKLAKLRGAYVYGDYDTGRIWQLRYDRKNQKLLSASELVDSSMRLVGFGQDSQGELYLLDHVSGRIHELVPNPNAGQKSNFPTTLSATGLFDSVKTLTPAAGLIPYDVIAPQWADGATKQRFLALPNDSKMEFETLTYPQPAPGSPPGWKFPNGTVIVETVFLETKAGHPESRRRIETRILHHERLSGDESNGDQYWQGYTYVWNDQQTDAQLLLAPQGRDKVFQITDPQAPGGVRQQTWHFPSRTECTVCHNMAAKYVLGVTTHQMNRDRNYGDQNLNQLDLLDKLGCFTKRLPAPTSSLPRLVDYRVKKNDLDRRARSYLHANCSHCHRKWGGGNARFQLLDTLDLSETGTLGVRPGQGTFGMAAGKVLAAGDPYRSVLFFRMSKLGAGRMPRIGSSVVDPVGTRLIHDWIASLPSASPEPNIARSRGETAVAMKALKSTASDAERAAQIDSLLKTTPGSIRLLHATTGSELDQATRSQVIRSATAHASATVRDLFERYLPEEKRVKRLGTTIKPAQILSLPGDIARGRDVFFKTDGVQCRNCHKIAGQGNEVGPDLSGVGKKFTRAQILESILQPSKKIEPKWLTYVVETVQGRVFTGLLVSKDDKQVVLKDAKDKLTRIAAEDVDVLAAQQKSLMPDLLVRDMTAQQVADLTAFLSSLKTPVPPKK